MAASPRLKVIIVGGSVAGLTLAHTFESTGKIDFVLLESRDNVAPPLGATIVVMPNGARILDQLGIMEVMKEARTDVNVAITRTSNGALLNKNEWPRLIGERFGYPVGIFERQRFLQILYDQLKHKERILVNKRVVNIVHGADSVSVECADGTAYEADLVIGADGIHSKVRKEMQKIAHESHPGLMKRDEEGITAEYSCFFGLTPPNTTYNLPPGSITTSSDINHSSLLFAGRDCQPQWFFVIKLDQKYRSSAIPRFTKAETDAKIAQYANFQLAPGVTLKKLLDTSIQSSYLPLEEGNFEYWSWGRLVCVGDSVHKMTPNIGQGGNQAIESATVLTNCLMEILAQKPDQKPTIAELEPAFKKFQKIREKRSAMFVKLSGLVTRAEANEKLSHTIQLLFVEPWTAEFMADIQTGLYKSAPWLQHLPLPSHLKDNEVWNDQRVVKPPVRARL